MDYIYIDINNFSYYKYEKLFTIKRIDFPCNPLPKQFIMRGQTRNVLFKYFETDYCIYNEYVSDDINDPNTYRVYIL